jgi:hypothetical protein
MRRALALLGLAIAAVVLSTPAAQSAADTGRAIAVRTTVSASLDPDDDPYGLFHLALFRVAVQNDGPANGKKGEIWVVVVVDSIEKPEIVGRQGLRCNSGDIEAVKRAIRTRWRLRCRSSLPFRVVEGPLSVLVRVWDPSGRTVDVAARALEASPGDPDLTVTSNRARAKLRLPGKLRDTWTGRWDNIVPALGFWELHEDGHRVTGTWMGDATLGTLGADALDFGRIRGTFHNKRDNLRGEFELRLDGTVFSGTWRHDTDPPGTAKTWEAQCTKGACLTNGRA